MSGSPRTAAGRALLAAVRAWPADRYPSVDRKKLEAVLVADIPRIEAEAATPGESRTLVKAATRYFAALDRLNGAHEARLAVGTDWTRLAAEHAGAEAALRAALAEVPVIPDELTRKDPATPPESR
jgi:hypothetical protein